MHPISTKAESMGGTPILMSDLDDTDLMVACQLHYMLIAVRY